MRHIVGLLAFVLAVLGSSYSHAMGTSNDVIVFQQVATNEFQAMQRAAAAGGFGQIGGFGSGGSTGIRNTYDLVLGKGVQVVVDRPLTNAAIARAITLGAKALPVVGTVIAGLEIAREFGLWPTSAGGWYVDPGVDQVDKPGQEFHVPGCGAWYRTRQQASAACTGVANGSGGWQGCTGSFEGADWVTSCHRIGSTTMERYANIVSSLSTIVRECPDASSALYRNGKCSTVASVDGTSTGSTHPPSSDAAAEAAWEGVLSESTVDAIQLARNVQAKGWPIEAGSPNTSGPPEVDHGTKQTTGPEGTITEQIKQALQYLGDKIIAGTKTTTTQVYSPTTNNTTTTTTTSNVTETGDALCKEYPKASACAELGDVPEAVELPASSVDFNIEPDSGWGLSQGSCPQHTVSFLGQPILIDLTLVCDGMSMIRPVVLGVSFLLAGMILIGVRTGGDA